MANPRSRQEFGQYCLRALGAPVLEINVSEEQVDDRIDFALKTYWDYHFDGSEKVYYKYNIQDKDTPGHLSEIEVANSGIGYSNTDTVTITAEAGTSGSGLSGAAHIVTNANGSITQVVVDNIGTGYLNAPTISITSTNGTGGVLVAFNGGYIPIPDNIIGAINIFDIGGAMGTGGMFNIQYQIALNDMYTLASTSMAPYFLAVQQIQFMEYLLVGHQPIRYNRHKNKLYLDMDWNRVSGTPLIIVEAYQIVDPDVYNDAWNDRWLLMYATAQIKKQWGNNLKKYGNMMLPGGIVFNGQKIWDEAETEIKELEQRMIMDYGIPVLDMIG